MSANYSEFTSQTKQRDGQAATANRSKWQFTYTDGYNYVGELVNVIESWHAQHPVRYRLQFADGSEMDVSMTSCIRVSSSVDVSSKSPST